MATGQVFREVRTEDELRTALTPTNLTDVGAQVANIGRRIVIAAPITITSPIVIPPEMAGVTIESHGHIVITCGAGNIDAFDVRASLTTIRGLLFTSLAFAGKESLGIFNRCVIVGSNAAFVRVLDCHIFDCGGILYVADGCPEGILRGCQVGTTAATTRDCVSIDAVGWRVEGNILEGAGTGLAVLTSSTSSRCAIIGNDCATDGIDTSASSGLNVISSNTRAGTIANAASDAVGLNT